MGIDMEKLGAPVVRRWQDGCWQELQETVATEERIHVLWPGGEGVLWAWPFDLEPLCLGHALLEMERKAPCRTGRVRGQVKVLSDEPGKRAFQVMLKPLPLADDDRNGYPEPGSLSPESLLHAMQAFQTLPGSCPGLWEATGCFHRAGLFDVRRGCFACLAEDTGRHNCLDRLVGWASLHEHCPGEHVLFLSSRITGSLYARARIAGFRFLVGRGTVTSMPVAPRDDAMTIVGFCRTGEGRFTVFQDPGRIVPR